MDLRVTRLGISRFCFYTSMMAFGVQEAPSLVATAALSYDGSKKMEFGFEVERTSLCGTEIAIMLSTVRRARSSSPREYFFRNISSLK